MSQLTNSEIDRLMYADGYRLGETVLSPHFSKKRLRDAQKQLFSSIDSLIESLLNKAKTHDINIDCKMGCSMCCHQAVFANTFEIDYLVDFLKQKKTKTELKEIYARAKSKDQTVKRMLRDDMLNYKEACPLLEDKVCGAYEARPMACRIYMCTDVGTCIRFYDDPNDRDNYPALLDFPLKAGRMLNEGFVAALKAAKKSSEVTIEKGLRIALQDIIDE